MGERNVVICDEITLRSWIINRNQLVVSHIITTTVLGFDRWCSLSLKINIHVVSKARESMDRLRTVTVARMKEDIAVSPYYISSIV